MLASTPVFLAVVVLLFLLAVLFSCTRMERMSPTAAALLSATMGRGTALSFQSESELATIARNRVDRASKPEAAPRPCAAAARLKRNQDGLFILDLSTKFPAGLQIAHAHHLARQAIFQHLHFEHHLQR